MNTANCKQKLHKTIADHLIFYRYLTVDEKLQQKIKDIAQPSLDSLQLPAPVTGVVFESITFGQSPPYIDGCMALREKWEDNSNLEVGEHHVFELYTSEHTVHTHEGLNCLYNNPIETSILFQTLELVLGPRIDSKEFEVKIHLKGLGHVCLTGFQFNGQLQVQYGGSLDFYVNDLPLWIYCLYGISAEGQLHVIKYMAYSKYRSIYKTIFKDVNLTGISIFQVSILMDKSMSFPCIKHVYFTFKERPDIDFDLSLGVIGTLTYSKKTDVLINNGLYSCHMCMLYG